MINRVVYCCPYNNLDSGFNTSSSVKDALSKLGISTHEVQVNSSKIEDYDSFIESGIEISRQLTRLHGIPALVELHGLCVTALNNRPGHFFTSGSPHAVIGMCENLPNRSAFRYHLFVLAETPSSPRLIIADSAQYGMLASNGHISGYSSIFIPQGESLTESQLPEEKQNTAFKRALNQLVHRLQYLQQY